MVKMRKYFALVSGAAALALAACAAPENQMLDQARAAYSVARNDPRIIQNAPTELNQAAQALQEAENLYEQDAEERQVTHQAYLANQQVAIAREAAQLKMTQDAIAQTEVQRQQVLLQARSREAEMARQEAARSQKELEQAQAQLSEAERARQTQQLQGEAEQARREAEAARQQAQMREKEIAELQRQVSEAETRETPRGIVLSLKDVVFPVDKADLNPGAERTIGKIADFLKQHPDRAIVIEGFTDSTGPADYNRELSDLRAEAVRDALVRHGVEAERITAQGFGEQYPVASNDTPAGRQMNRRVEIVISGGAEGSPTAGAAGRREMQGRAAAGSAGQAGETQMGFTGRMNAEQLIGTAVRDRQGQEIGEVTDVMMNFAKGRASFARISSTDGKSYLVPLNALTSEQEGNFVTLNADRSVVETSPLPRQGVSEEQYGRELYEHYGLSYPWEESAE